MERFCQTSGLTPGTGTVIEGWGGDEGGVVVPAVGVPAVGVPVVVVPEMAARTSGGMWAQASAGIPGGGPEIVGAGGWVDGEDGVVVVAGVGALDAAMIG